MGRWMNRFWLGTVPVVLALGCGGKDEGADVMLYLMSERYEHTEQGEEWAGGGCMLAVSSGEEGGSSSTTGGKWVPGQGLDPDFVYEETTDNRLVTVKIYSNDEVIEERQYGEDFLSSGEVDRFEVTTARGRVFRFGYWGGPECDTSHLPLDD